MLALFQIHYGDLTPAKLSKISGNLAKYFPQRLLEEESEESKVVVDQLKSKWESLKGKNVHDCVRIFLTCTRKWQFFGAKLFKVKVSAHIFLPIDIFFAHSVHPVSKDL